MMARATTFRVRTSFKRIMRAYRELSEAICEAEAYGLLDYDDYIQDAPQSQMAVLLDKIEVATDLALTRAIRCELMSELEKK